MLERRLALHGKLKRLWLAEVKGKTVRIASGVAGKEATFKFKESEHAGNESACDALRKAQLAKLRSGYLLDGPHGALVALLAVESGSAVALSPDGTRVWSVLSDVYGNATLRIRLVATGAMLLERPFERAIGSVSDIHARSSTEALVATSTHGILRVRDDGTWATWSEAGGGAYRLVEAGDRVVTLAAGRGFLLDTRDGSVVAQFENARAITLAADGKTAALCRDNGTSIEIVNASDGSERARLSLVGGQGVNDLAIGKDHVVATSIWFPGSARRATWVWSLATGARVLTERFGDADNSGHAHVTLGAGGLLTFAGGGVEVLDLPDVTTPKLVSYELWRRRTSGGIRATADGRFLAGYDGSGLVAVWDFSRILDGHGDNEFLAGVAEHADTPQFERLGALQEAPVAAADDGTFRLDLGVAVNFIRPVAGGALYTSFASKVTTFVDFATWPPRSARRASTSIRCARTTGGVWLISDQEGLWTTTDFVEQGEKLSPPFEPDEIGWLGASPVIFDRDGEVPPQRFVDGRWHPITDLAKPDAPGSTGAILLADGTSILTFRGVAYRVDDNQRAHRLFEGERGLDGRALALPDGRIAYSGGLEVWLDGGRRPKTSLAIGSKKHGIEHLTPGPGGSLLVTFSSGGKPNRTDLAGSILTLGNKTIVLEKQGFRVEKTTVLSELFTCGPRIVARVAFGETFRTVDIAEVAGF